MTAYSKNPKVDSLLQLSEEVSRIAGTLAQLSTVPSTSEAAAANTENVPEVSAVTIGAVIRARRLRSHYFSEDLFADPAWDILLNLFHADLCQRRVSVSRSCAAAAVPPTTALRWLKSMEKQGLIIRRNDPFDHRRVFVELAPDTSLALKRYFSELEHPAGI
jgi:DNA-binding MarR family transcriptional regulator